MGLRKEAKIVFHFVYSAVSTNNCIKILRNATGNLSNLASQIFQDNTGHNILDLFNNVLTEKGPGTHFCQSLSRKSEIISPEKRPI